MTLNVGALNAFYVSFSCQVEVGSMVLGWHMITRSNVFCFSCKIEFECLIHFFVFCIIGNLPQITYWPFRAPLRSQELILVHLGILAIFCLV